MALVVTVHLLRHGEVFNPDGVLYGRLPGFRLSELGERQAVAAAAWLAERRPVRIVSSPLERARQTAAPLAELTGLDVGIDERLIEAGNVFEGRPVAGGAGLFRNPTYWKYFRDPLTPSWGEPYREIAARMLSAMTSLATELNEGGEAVCVTHQLPVVIARRRVEGLRLAHDPRRRQCALASVTSFEFIGTRAVRVRYAEPAADLPAGTGAGA